MNIINFFIVLFAKFIATLSAVIANTSTYACIAWFWEEPKMPKSLINKQNK